MRFAPQVLFFILFTGTCYGQGTRSDTSFTAYASVLPGTSVSFRMLPVPAGQFIMGSPESESERRTDEGPQRSIALSSFWMGEHEVTYDEFLVYVEDETTSRNAEADAVTRPTAQYIDLSWGMGKAGGYPVNSMSQYTALMYCRWLYQKTGIFYRLPTEAEWEYACRAGTQTTYPFGNNPKLLKEYAWYADNSKKKYQKVMQKKPNPWGFYDMMGNVAEWTLDQYQEDYFITLSEEATDPRNPVKNRYPVTVRGGGFTDPAAGLRPASRIPSAPSWNKRDPQIPKSKWWLTDGMWVGFRLVRPRFPPGNEEIDAFYKEYLGN